MADRDNPRVSTVTRVFTWIEVVVVGAAAGLYTVPALVIPFWPWQLTPFNAFFVGATYFAAWVPLVIFASTGRWNPGRVVVPMIGVFTTYILVISLIGAQSLLWDRFGTYIWMALYITLPISTAFQLWQSRGWPPVDPQPTSGIWRVVLLAQAAVLGLYGLAMLIAPEPANAWWPWPIDAFNGRMYGANFLTLAAGSLILSRVASRLERAALGSTALTLGVVAIAGLFKTDLGLGRVAWGAPNTLAWVGLFALIGIVGGVLTLTALGRERAPATRAV